MLPGTPVPGPSDHQTAVSGSFGTSIAPSASIPTGTTSASTPRIGILSSTGATCGAGAAAGAVPSSEVAVEDWSGAEAGPGGSAASPMAGTRRKKPRASSSRELKPIVDRIHAVHFKHHESVPLLAGTDEIPRVEIGQQQRWFDLRLGDRR